MGACCTRVPAHEHHPRRARTPDAQPAEIKEAHRKWALSHATNGFSSHCRFSAYSKASRASPARRAAGAQWHLHCPVLTITPPPRHHHKGPFEPPQPGHLQRELVWLRETAAPAPLQQAPSRDRAAGSSAIPQGSSQALTRVWKMNHSHCAPGTQSLAGKGAGRPQEPWLGQLLPAPPLQCAAPGPPGTADMLSATTELPGLTCSRRQLSPALACSPFPFPHLPKGRGSCQTMVTAGKEALWPIIVPAPSQCYSPLLCPTPCEAASPSLRCLQSLF